MYAHVMENHSAVHPVVMPLCNDSKHNVRSGKDKDVYDFGDMLLIISTDRFSAFGKSFGQEIKDKGLIITQLSAYWFRKLRNICPNHLISVKTARFPDAIKSVAINHEGQALLVRKASPLSIRCVVRGYLAGAGWREYRESGQICGNKLPLGLVESQRLPTPIFTPTTKGRPDGKNENIDYHQLQGLLGEDLAKQLREASIRLYFNAWKSAREKGVLIADSKFEFGLNDGTLMLIDECLTPETSRFWSMEKYRYGGPMPSMDKQILADYLEISGTPEMIPLPDEMLIRLGEKYHEAFKRIIGKNVHSRNRICPGQESFAQIQ